VDNDDFYSYYDSLNPCLRSEEYLTYLDSLYLEQGLHNTISSLSTTTRVHQLATRLDNGLQTLEELCTLASDRSYACFLLLMPTESIP
jgi:hypothetical protein